MQSSDDHQEVHHSEHLAFIVRIPRAPGKPEVREKQDLLVGTQFRKHIPGSLRTDSEEHGRLRLAEASRGRPDLRTGVAKRLQY